MAHDDTDCNACRIGHPEKCSVHRELTQEEKKTNYAQVILQDALQACLDEMATAREAQMFHAKERDKHEALYQEWAIRRTELVLTLQLRQDEYMVIPKSNCRNLDIEHNEHLSDNDEGVLIWCNGDPHDLSSGSNDKEKSS